MKTIVRVWWCLLLTLTLGISGRLLLKRQLSISVANLFPSILTAKRLVKLMIKCFPSKVVFALLVFQGTCQFLVPCGELVVLILQAGPYLLQVKICLRFRLEITLEPVSFRRFRLGHPDIVQCVANHLYPLARDAYFFYPICPRVLLKPYGFSAARICHLGHSHADDHLLVFIMFHPLLAEQQREHKHEELCGALLPDVGAWVEPHRAVLVLVAPDIESPGRPRRVFQCEDLAPRLPNRCRAIIQQRELVLR
mmetsp:Transcript_59222/g.150291  ORF Transcript_59222/g.150291 Transcript_59222/m.150291 type:complete len:252 (-) Transcript_59222:288-1043(-)